MTQSHSQSIPARTYDIDNDAYKRDFHNDQISSMERDAADAKMPQYQEFFEMSTRTYRNHLQFPTEPPRPEAMRDADTYYQDDQPAPDNGNSEQNKYFNRSLEFAEEFPMHIQKELGTIQAKKVQKESFGAEQPRNYHIPNFKRVKPINPIVTHDYRAYYEGKQMVHVAGRQYPDTVYVTPGTRLNSIPQKQVDELGLTQTRETYFKPRSNSTGNAGHYGHGKFLTEEDILYKHKRAYNKGFPLMDDRHHPEKTAAIRALINGNATIGSNSSAASFFLSPNFGEKEPDTGIRDEQCTFKPYALQRPTPFHPQFASGKPVSSTFQFQPQVSYLPVDTSPTVNAIRHTTMINIKSEQPGTMTPHERAIKPKENPYQVTTYSSFAEAAKKSPKVVLTPEEKDKEYRLKKKNAVMNKTASVTSGTLTMSNAIKAREEAEPIKTQDRPPLRISIHPQRDGL